MNRRTLVLLGVFSSVLVAGTAHAQVGARVDNWAVPAYRSQPASGGLSAMTDISPGTTFVAMTPCRVFDTRAAAGPYGGPRLVANATRSFDVNNSPCGPIPAEVEAYSMNFGAIQADGDGFITIWPAGSAQPTVSAINTLAGEVIANAAIVPAGTSGSISVFPNTGVHLYGDINGYFTDAFNAGNQLIQNGVVNGGATGSFSNSSTVVGSSAVTGMLFEPAVGLLAQGQLGTRGFFAQEPSGLNGMTMGIATANDTAAVRGDAFGATNRVYGGRFFSNSKAAGAAGVIGFSADVAFAGIDAGGYAGVIGIASSGQGVVGVASGLGTGVAGYRTDAGGAVLSAGELGWSSSVGIAFFNGLTGSGTKNFIEPHPTDASKVISYISLEGNEAGTYFRGRGKFQNGVAVIDVPEDFRMVTDTDGLGIQVTPIGQMATVAVESIGLDRIVVRGSRNVEFFYTVNGVRRAYKDAKVIVENEKFFVPGSPDAKLPLYLSDDERQRLITNGTYKADGTVNMETAERLGWTRIWEEKGRRPQPVAPPAP